MGREFSYRTITDEQPMQENERIMNKREYGFVCTELYHITTFEILKIYDKFVKSTKSINRDTQLTDDVKQTMIKQLTDKHDVDCQTLWDNYHKYIKSFKSDYMNKKIVVKYNTAD